MDRTICSPIDLTPWAARSGGFPPPVSTFPQQEKPGPEATSLNNKQTGEQTRAEVRNGRWQEPEDNKFQQGTFKTIVGYIILFNYSGIILARVNYLLKTRPCSNPENTVVLLSAGVVPKMALLGCAGLGRASFWCLALFLHQLLIANELNFPRR